MVTGGTADLRNLAVNDRKETALHKWAEELKPDYLGPVAAGLKGCLLSHWEPRNDRFVWSFGYGVSMSDAREQAIQNMVEQRLRGLLWLPEDM